MMTEEQSPTSRARLDPVTAYRPDATASDEMCGPDGEWRAHWRTLGAFLSSIGRTGLIEREQRLRRLLRESGVTYNVYTEGSVSQRPWRVDPIPLLLDQAEWSEIEAGLQQRALLMDAILSDVYGPQRLLRDGLIPAELVLAHPAFQRACVGCRHPGQHRLVVYAADLARGPDGRQWILGDRSQAPSGFGYALENRTTIGRVMPGIYREAGVRRLAGFFRNFQRALAQLAPEREHPNVVVLTPGARNETYFEHAYLASYLGYTLAQGDDLTVRRGRVLLKTVEGLESVDVILRRVDDTYCDPLELRQDSRLGVPGLLEAARRGQVAIANPLGSGVLENPALTPFLPSLAERLLGERLRLPSVATWWCGQRREMNYVLAHMGELVIKPIFRGPGYRAGFGPLLSEREREELKRRIRAEPHLFVGQERVDFSTAPSLIDEHLEPRHSVLRCFLVADGKGYFAMPGGLTRVASSRGELQVSNQEGGVSKDTWIVGVKAEEHRSLWSRSQHHVGAGAARALPSRAADNLFWVGRYAERAEYVARLLRTTLLRFGESRELPDRAYRDSLEVLLPALTHCTATYPGFVGKQSRKRLADPLPGLLDIAIGPGLSTSIAGILRAFADTAYATRELWSVDTWRLVDTLQQHAQQSPSREPDLLLDWLDRCVGDLMGFAGLTSESMNRDAGWRFLDLGRRIERALLVISTLRSCVVAPLAESVEGLVLESVLSASESLVDFRRRYRGLLETRTVLDHLLLEARSPRSLAYQLEALEQHTRQLPRAISSQRFSREERVALEAAARLKLADLERLSSFGENGLRDELDQLLQHVDRLLRRLSELIELSYFSHSEWSRPILAGRLEPEP
jgi:uncharacterized circularly permuted ATP-grasp superfamily protein/uncharacterized alpha-E superfamily protein